MSPHSLCCLACEDYVLHTALILLFCLSQDIFWLRSFIYTLGSDTRMLCTSIYTWKIFLWKGGNPQSPLSWKLTMCCYMRKMCCELWDINIAYMHACTYVHIHKHTCHCTSCVCTCVTNVLAGFGTYPLNKGNWLCNKELHCALSLVCFLTHTICYSFSSLSTVEEVEDYKDWAEEETKHRELQKQNSGNKQESRISKWSGKKMCLRTTSAEICALALLMVLRSGLQAPTVSQTE